MKEITLKSYGKINLGLDVCGVREDGYHLLNMLLQTVDVYDIVTVSTGSAASPGEIDQAGSVPQISVHSNIPSVPNDQYNLAYQAARIIADEYGIEESIRVNIDKRLPVAAGMAGGSANAASVITAMDELFGLGMLQSKKDEIALKIGTDVPFCLRRGTYLARGIGEDLTKLLDAPRAHVLIVRPMFGISTKWAYKSLDEIEEPWHPDMDAAVSAIGKGDLKALAASMDNILEQVALPCYPIIYDIKEEIVNHGALGAMMTGSGPTVFGLFEDEKKAKEACAFFEGSHLTCRCFLTRFLGA